MIGERWNTLVAPPTERELEAAMAAVRVRALEHWKRRIWRGRALLAVAFVAVAAAGAAGGRGLGSSVRLSADEPDYAPSPRYRATVEAGPVIGAAPPGDLRRFHVARLTEMDGVPIAQGDAWVEGPEGTAFYLTVFYEGQRFGGDVSIFTFGDSIAVNITGHVESFLGWTDRGGRVTERRSVNTGLRAHAGQRLTFYPFGSGRDADGARTAVTITGPWADAPVERVTWRESRADSVLYRFGRGAAIAENRQWLATRQPIRYANRNVGGLFVRPRWLPPEARLR
jgi:hypothetical protein